MPHCCNFCVTTTHDLYYYFNYEHTRKLPNTIHVMCEKCWIKMTDEPVAINNKLTDENYPILKEIMFNKRKCFNSSCIGSTKCRDINHQLKK